MIDCPLKECNWKIKALSEDGRCPCGLQFEENSSGKFQMISTTEKDTSLVLISKEPLVLKNVAENRDYDYLVVYLARFDKTECRCASCDSYLTTTNVIQGDVTPKPCTRQLRLDQDGRSGRCKTTTKFVFKRGMGIDAM